MGNGRTRTRTFQWVVPKRILLTGYCGTCTTNRSLAVEWERVLYYYRIEDRIVFSNGKEGNQFYMSVKPIFVFTRSIFALLGMT